MTAIDEQYNSFIKETEFKGLRLISSEFYKKKEFDDFEINDLKTSFSYEVKSITSNERIILIEVLWSLIVKKSNMILVKIHIGYELAYTNSKMFNEDIASKFVDIVIKPVSFPYLRQSINQISQDADLNIPQLPMLKFLPTNSTAKEAPSD